MFHDLEENLLSVGQFMENGCFLVFRDNYCKIYDKIEPNQVIVEVKMIKKKIHLQIHCNAFKNEVVDDLWFWHQRFCHLNFHGLKLLKQKDMVQGLPEIHIELKIENTSIISLDVSNQEENEEEEDVPQRGEISDYDVKNHLQEEQKC